VLLADEPTGALDSHTSYEILKLLQQVQAEGVTVIIITHERDIANMTDRIIHLIDGRIDWDRPVHRHDPEAEIGTAAPNGDGGARLAEVTLPGAEPTAPMRIPPEPQPVVPE
jgi:ABC-type multidrug transport system ATPase subunit